MAYIGTEPIPPIAGGTGVANSNTSTLTLGGALSLIGAFTAQFHLTNNTNVTFPTSGVLATTSVPGGGTGTNTFTAHSILLGNGISAISSVGPSATTGAPLISSGASADPGFSTTVTINDTTPLFAFVKSTAGSVSFSTQCTGSGTALISSTANSSGNGAGFFSSGQYDTTKFWNFGMVPTNAGTNAGGYNISYNTVGQSDPSGGTPMLRIATTGAVTIPTSLTLGSGTALTTYVQGTFVPVLNFGGGTTGITYSTQTGQYTQIGNIVYYLIDIVLTNKGSSTGTAQISGLPVAANSTGTRNRAFVVMQSVTLTASYTDIFFNPNNSATTGFFSQQGSGQALAVVADTNFANGSAVSVNGWYFTS